MKPFYGFNSLDEATQAVLNLAELYKSGTVTINTLTKEDGTVYTTTRIETDKMVIAY